MSRLTTSFLLKKIRVVIKRLKILRQTRRIHAEDSQLLRYTIHFAILIIAKFQEADIWSYLEKCDKIICDADARRRIVIPTCRLRANAGRVRNNVFQLAVCNKETNRFPKSDKYIL